MHPNITKLTGFFCALLNTKHFPVQFFYISQQQVDVLICSDLVARGMDIESIDCVVSYDIPPFVEAFVHRIGRTARAGKSGTAVALLTSEEVSSFKSLLKKAEIPFPKEVFVEDASLEQYVEAFKSALTSADATIR